MIDRSGTLQRKGPARRRDDTGMALAEPRPRPRRPRPLAKDPKGPLSSREAHAYVADRLRWPMSLRTFLYHAKRGHLPCLRFGSRYLFWAAELDQWLTTRVVRVAAPSPGREHAAPDR